MIKSGPDGREQILRFLGPGEIFNEIDVFARHSNQATAMALEESGIWLIPRTALEHVLFAHPHTAMQIMGNLAERIASLVSLTADLSLRTVEARLAKMLLEQADNDIMPRQRWATQSELAAHLGTVPDVLSRVLRELNKAGLIEIGKPEIRILDRAGWEKRALMQSE